MRGAQPLSLPPEPLTPFGAPPPRGPQTHLTPCRCLFRGALHSAHHLSRLSSSALARGLSHGCCPRVPAGCGHPGCWRQRKGEANAPHRRQSFPGPGLRAGPEGDRPGLAGHPGISPCPSETLPSGPSPQDGRRRDLSRPISSLAEQGFYPPLPRQLAFSSGSLALCTWYRDDRQGGFGGIRAGGGDPD